jgi:hypothetical protein
MYGKRAVVDLRQQEMTDGRHDALEQNDFGDDRRFVLVRVQVVGGCLVEGAMRSYVMLAGR